MADGSVIIDTGLDTSGVDMGAKEVEKRIGTLVSTVNRIGAGLSKTFSGLFKGIGAAVQQSTSGVTNTAQQATQAQAAAAKTTGEYDKQLSALQKQIDAAKGKLSDYYQALDRIHEFTDEALQYAATDADAGNVLDTEQEQIAALNEKYTEKLSVLQELEAEYARVAEARDAALQAPVDDTDSTEGQAAAGGIRAVGSAEDAAASKTSRLASMLAGLGRVMSTVGNHALNLGKRLGQMSFNAVSKGIKKGISALKSFSAQTNKTTLTANGLVHSLTSLKRLLITRIKRMFISSIFNNVKKGLTALEGYSSEFKGVMDSLRSSAKAAAGNISVALSGLVTAIAPVLQYLINLLNTVLSLINQVFALLGGGSTYTVVGNGSGAMQNLSANANDSAEALKNAADAQKSLNGEMYSYDELTHKEKKNDASSNAEAYANAANDAAEAQGKLNAELYGYDELTRQNKQGGGGGGGGGGGFGFEEQPIGLPEAVVDWIERLKKAWQDGDWYSVGSVVAEGLNAAMEVVDDWINNKFRPIAVEWANRAAQILNGLIDGLDWKKLGKTLADGVNAVFDAVNTFLTTTHWLTLGRRISDAVKSWFDNVEWDLVGETFANKWNALIRTIRGFVTNSKMWESIGKSIGQFVKSWFSTIDINSIAGVLIGVLNGVTASIKAFLSQNPFEGVAKKISDAINRVVHEVDWAELGKTISDLFMEMLNTLHDVVKQIDWRGIGVAIGEFLGSIDWAGVFATLADTIWTAFKGVLEGLFSTSGGRVFLGILAGVKGLGAAFTLGKAALLPKILGFNTLGSKLVTSIGLGITGAIAGFGVYFAALQDALTNGLNWLNGVMIPIGSTIGMAGIGAIVGSLGGPLTAGIGALIGLAIGLVTDGIIAIKEHWTEITAWITEKWNAFAGWISGAWNSLATFAGNVWNTITTAVTTAFDAAVSWVKQAAADLGNWISTTWTNITTWTTTAWNNIKTAISTAFGDAKNWVVNTATTIGTQISTTWTNITTWTTTAWNNIKTGISTAFTNAKTAVINTANNIKTSVSTTWNNLKTATTTAWNSIKTGISTAFTNAKNAVVNTASALKSNLSSAWNSIKSTASSAWNNIKSTATSAWTSLSQTVSSKWQSLKSTLGSVEWGSIGRNLVEGLKNGVGGAWQSLVSKAQSLAQGLIAKFKSWFSIGSPSKVFAEIGKFLDAGLEQGIMDGEGKLLHTAGNIAAAVTSGMTPDSPKVSMTAEAVVGSMQAVISGLSNVAATFKTIADTLTSIGSLPIPAIAEGTVVPYRVRTAANEAPMADSTDTTQTSLTEILSEMREQNRLLQLIEAAARNGSSVKVQIDGREVFNTVVNENNRAIRRTGTSPIRV